MRIEQGSTESKDSAHNLHRIPKNPTLIAGSQEEKNAQVTSGGVFMHDHSGGITRRTYDKSKEFNSLQSSQRSFEV